VLSKLSEVRKKPLKEVNLPKERLEGLIVSGEINRIDCLNPFWINLNPLSRYNMAQPVYLPSSQKRSECPKLCPKKRRGNTFSCSENLKMHLPGNMKISRPMTLPFSGIKYP
jgi:hypothetical protein